MNTVCSKCGKLNCNPHLHKKQSAPVKLISKFLRSLGIPFQREVSLGDKKRYDFCIWVGYFILIEYDGAQHFRQGKYARTQKKLENIQEKDILKTFNAVKAGIKLIRIDYTCKDIEKHILAGISSPTQVFVSNVEKYMHLWQIPNVWVGYLIK